MATELQRTKHNMTESEKFIKKGAYVVGRLRNRKAGAAYPQPAFFM